MADDSTRTAEPSGPDHFLLDQENRGPDGGPLYKETPADPFAPDAPLIAEPYNTVTASFFIVIVLVWAYRLWGRFGRYPFMSACGPILLAGGIGGTLYHATRTSRVWFLLDVVPISILGAAGAIYLTIRLGRSVGLGKVLVVSVGLLAAYLFVNAVLFNNLGGTGYKNLRVNLSYASLAVMLLVPLAATLVRTRFRYWAWVAGGLVSFAIAWYCRLIDGHDSLPMGTHWLWHTFGAISTQAVTEYFYRIEGEGKPPTP